MQVAGGLVESMSGGVSGASPAPNASRAKAPADQDPSATPAFAALLTGAMTPQPQPEPAARPHPTAETKGELAEGAAQETGEEGTSTTGASAKGAAPELVAGQHAADALRFGLRADAVAPNAVAPDATAPDATAPNAVAHAATAEASGSADVGATKGARRRTRGDDAEEQDGKDATTAVTGTDAAQLARALDAVDPALRARLEHVVERMRAEGGHEADADAGARTSTRQDGRAVQGRTHDGAAVTSPTHAPDVAVDGGWDDKAAFEQFQRVAGHDALPDASHHELPHDTRVEQLTVQGTAQSAPPAAPAAALTALATAQGRATADVASNAKADAKADAAVDAVEAPADGARARTAFLQATHAALAAQRGDASRSSDGGDRRGSQRTPQRAVSGAGARSASASNTGAPTAGAPAANTLGTPAFSAPAEVAAPAPLTGALSAERVAHLLETRDSAPAQPMSSLTLSIDNLAGGVDRIRVGLRGLEVGTSIDLADKSVAERVQASIGELRSALDRHGLTTDTVQISSAGRAAEAVDGGRLVAAAAGAAGADRSGTSTSNGSSQQQSSQQQQARDPRDAARDAARENNPDQRRNRRDTQSSEDGEPNTGRRSRRDRR